MEIEDTSKTLDFDKVSFYAVVDRFVTEGECLYAMIPKIEKPLNLAHPSQPVLKGGLTRIRINSSSKINSSSLLFSFSILFSGGVLVYLNSAS